MSVSSIRKPIFNYQTPNKSFFSEIEIQLDEHMSFSSVNHSFTKVALLKEASFIIIRFYKLIDAIVMELLSIICNENNK